MDGDMKDLNIKLIDTQERFNQHTQSVNLTMEKEFKRIEKVTRKFEGILADSIQEQADEMKKIEKRTHLWKKEMEQKNFTVFKEISNALKTLKNEPKL